MKTKKTIRVASVLIGGLTLLIAPSALAQCSFSSGSTGADGQFNPPTYVPAGTTISNNVVTVPLPANGIFNFTSVYVQTNYVVNFTRNVLNTPVYLLATTNVTIMGTIDVSGGNGSSTAGGLGGPGGFDGATTAGSHGFGPGGGGLGDGVSSTGGDGSYATVGWGGARPGPAYGELDILPMIGGSGGGWFGAGTGSGGAGGGAIFIASSGTITINGQILANGGWGDGWSGNGSGGAIRLIAPTVMGEGLISAQGYSWAGQGRIRLEACTLVRVRLTTPAATFGPPGVVFLNPNPTISVTSIAGANTPWPPVGSLTVPDVYLPTNFVNPATVSVLASNINPGTTFQVIITPVYGTNITATGTLTGSYAVSTGSASIDVYTDRVWRVNALIDYIPRP